MLAHHYNPTTQGVEAGCESENSQGHIARPASKPTKPKQTKQQKYFRKQFTKLSTI